MKNVYIEITNVCNLSCSFCPGHKRPPRFMSTAEFEEIIGKTDGNADNIFLHVMGEPLLHPELEEIIKIADGMQGETALKITTNGTLLAEKLPILLESKRLKTLCISLHSFEANCGGDFEKYIENCLDSAEKVGKTGKFAVLRLWNEGGLDSLNEKIFDLVKTRFPQENWQKTRRGMRIGDHVFVEFGEKFVWPDGGKLPESIGDLETDCHALLTQYAILCDGTVVPCCLDSNGEIPLGNIFEQTPEAILSSPRAKRMRDGIAAHKVTEKLCATCSKRCGAFQR